MSPSTLPEWQRQAIEAVKATPGVVVLGALQTSVASGLSGALLPALSSAADADVMLDFSGGELGCAPPLGVWRFGFGRGTAAGGGKGTAVRLYRVTSRPGLGVVLHEGWYRAWTSEAWGTTSVTERVAPWCARVLRQVAAGQIDLLEASPRSIDDCSLYEPPHCERSWPARLRFRLQDWIGRQRWTIGVVPLRLEQILERQAMPEPAWLQGQRSDRFYADPFPLGCDNGCVQLLVEDYRYLSRHKRISVLDVSMTGALRADRIVPGLPADASYPFVLRVEDSVVCLPETFRARRLAAYTQTRDGPWICSGELIRDFPVVDATLVAHDGLWWLFCMKQGDEDQTDLHLFYASEWRGPWTAHPLNPVKSDTRSSRPAGSCFVVDGVLYRPAQNCACRYGAGLAINRVRQLSMTGFREETVLQLAPSPESAWPDGLHTINGIGGVTIVDGLRVERRLTPPRAVCRPAAGKTATS